MSTTVMTTALPFSLAPGAPHHLSAFVTHKLTPDDGGTTLGAFPAVAHWVTTMSRGTWLVAASTLTEPVPATVVSTPQQSVWESLLPLSTPVRPFPRPRTSESAWVSYPAHAMDEIGTELHLAAMLTSPTRRPPADNPISRAVLSATLQVHRGARGLLARMTDPPAKPQRSKSQLDAMATLTGRTGRDQDRGERAPNPIELLLESQIEDEHALTDWLDRMVADGERPDGMLGTLVDLHAARRYYQPPGAETGYQERPSEGATTPPVQNPEPDVHQLLASAGSTPALLRALGIAVDLTVADEHLSALEKATWVSVVLVPAAADAAALEMLEPPRTRCRVSRGSWQALASEEWTDGRLELGDPDRYRVLWLDPDATALATEQNLRDVVGEIAAELNGDKANGAPTALRSSGFSLARMDRVAAARARTASAEALDLPAAGALSLTYDQILRGLRLQVREGGSGPWLSVHRRLVDVIAPTGAVVMSDVPDVGFLPLTSLSRPGTADGDRYRLHEVFAGWDGWSLSAPRPGKIVTHAADGSEQLVDEPPVPAGSGPLARVRSRVQPGTLPRLRYGRSYSFRVQGVDLAGNEVQAGEPLRRRVPDLRDRLTPRRGPGLGTQLQRALRPHTDGEEPLTRPGGPRAPRLRLAELAQEVAADSLVLPASRIRQVERQLVDLVGADRATTPVTDLDRLREAVARAVGDIDLHVRPDLLDPAAPRPDHPTDTAPIPFLRWSPVPPPALVARHELSPGESLQRIVIREGATSERHLAPPKTSQLEAELHGRFDHAIGSGDPAQHRSAYAWALRERGTLLDQWLPDLDNPGQQIEQPGMSLASRPGADPAAAVTLAQITTDRDTPLGEGQYVVHDVDQLVLPYLPDPLAAGVALVFLEAGPPHALPDPRVLSAVVLPFSGQWPRVRPLRLVLEGGDELGAALEEDAGVVRVRLPAGESVRVAVSSSLRAADLEVLGMWRALTGLLGSAGGEALRALLTRAAVSGWTWWLTPSEELRLVHATPRPARRPALHDLAVLARPAGSTVAALLGISDVHGPSTARISLAASWTEWVDDVGADAPVRLERHDVPMRSLVGERERYGLLHAWEDPDAEDGVPLHRAIQAFPDTHHRAVTYTLIGSTRYAEFFDPSDLPGSDDPQSCSDAVGLSIDSSARPDTPIVLETIPLISWETSTEPEQPFARRRVRRSGARIWLARPWYSSGDGELLAVVLGGELPPNAASRWGRDPTFQQTAAVDSAAEPPLLTAIDLLFTVSDEAAEPGTDADLQARPGGPVRRPQPQPLVDVENAPTAALLAYEPEFHPDRKQWFVDVAMTPRDQLWPFVRLAVARYQPHSLTRCALSPVVTTDWVQPLPERLATVSRPDAAHVHVSVSGAFADYPRPEPPVPEHPFVWDPARPYVDVPVSRLDAALLRSRVLVATVQERGESDLEWRDHAKVRLPAVGQDPDDGWQVTWSERLELPEPVPLATPETGDGEYRVLIEELEIMEGDRYPDPDEPQRTNLTRPVTRVVYADAFPL